MVDDVLVEGVLLSNGLVEEFELDEFDDEFENNESSVCVTACSAARTSCAACALVVAVVGVLLDELALEELELVVPGKFKVLELDESDDEPEKIESSVWETACSAARTSCAA